VGINKIKKIYLYLENLLGAVEPTGLCEVHTLGYNITGGHVARVSTRHDNEELAWFLHSPGERDTVIKQPAGRNHAAVRGQPCVMILTFSHSSGKQTLHGCSEEVALAGWHAVPHLVGAGMQVLDPWQPMWILVPAACREHHAHMYGGHSHAHHRAQRLEHRLRVVSEHLQVPRVFGKRCRLGCRESITLGTRINRTGQYAYVVFPVLNVFPVERLDIFGPDCCHS